MAQCGARVRKILGLYARLLRACDGGSAVEFSLVAFPFILIVFGSVTFGWIFFLISNMESAAREAARRMAVAEASFELLSGVLKTFAVTCDSGRLKTCSFCSDCGVRIYHQGPDRELSIKAGTLDDRIALQPEAHYWASRKQAWVLIPDGTQAYPDDN